MTHSSKLTTVAGPPVHLAHLDSQRIRKTPFWQAGGVRSSEDGGAGGRAGVDALTDVGHGGGEGLHQILNRGRRQAPARRWGEASADYSSPHAIKLRGRGRMEGILKTNPRSEKKHRGERGGKGQAEINPDQ